MRFQSTNVAATTQPPAGNQAAAFYARLPALLPAGSPYTIVHNLNTIYLHVQVWDTTTNQLINVLVTVLDGMRIQVSVQIPTPNPVNVIIFGLPTSGVPIQPGDIANKSYVDNKTLVGHNKRGFTGTVSLANSAWTVIPFDTQEELNDPQSFISFAGSTFTINQPGVYLITAWAQGIGGTAGQNTGRRAVSIWKNGAVVGHNGMPMASLLFIGLTTTATTICAIGDTFQCQIYQDCGTAIVGGTNIHMSVTYLQRIGS